MVEEKLRGVNNGLAIVLELAGMHDPDPGAEIYRCRKLADLCPVAPANNVAQPNEHNILCFSLKGSAMRFLNL